MENSHTFIYIVLLLTLSTYTNQAPIKYCYRYGSDSSLDNLSIGLKGKVFTNLETTNKVQIAFFTKKEDCETSCKKSKSYYSCLQANSSYDLKFGITAGAYVCWLKDECYQRTNEFEEYRHLDDSISYSSLAGCNYACNTVYMKKGHCMIHLDFNYHCYYKTYKDENMTEKEKMDRMERQARKLAFQMSHPTPAPAPAPTTPTTTNPSPAPTNSPNTPVSSTTK